MTESKRACPHCGENISSKATRCKYCFEEVVSRGSSSGDVAQGFSADAYESQVTLHDSDPNMAKYRVVPFIASVGSNEGAAQAAAQLEALIKKWSDMGWEYVRLERVETYVAGDAGCFGIGATPAQLLSYSMAVFKH
jgi:hypothetical protein